MSSRQGGKLKPLKAPKKAKADNDDEDTQALKEKQKRDAAALAAAKERALKGGPLGAGLKKSGKK